MEEENKYETLTVTDYLGLINVDVPDLPKDVMFPDELNRFLRDRIKYLNHENGMLHKTLEEHNVKLNESQLELKNLQTQFNKSQSSSSSFVSSSDVASSKIVELSKKLREKSSEIEVLKTKYSKLEKYLVEMQEQKEETDEMEPEKEIPKAEIEDIIKTLQNKLNSATSKLSEVRNTNTLLKNQLMVANKYIHQEVGENFESIANKSNWRGRAQIICDLQQKNSELRDKLKALQEKGINETPEPNNSTKNDKKVESLIEQNTSLIKKMQETKNKLESAKSRCKSLEMECTVYKTKLKSAQEQTDKDTQFLTSLTGQISYMQNNQTDSIKQIQKELQKVEAVNKKIIYELEQEKFKSANLNKVIEEKDCAIAQLCEKEPQNEKPIATLYDRNFNQFENEKLRLLGLINATKKKLAEERDAHSKTQSQYAHEKQKAVKLETKLAKLQLEHSDKYSTCSGYSSRASNKGREEILQDKLEIAEENIKVLTNRLELEKEERNLDLQEFENILKNYKLDNAESDE